MASPAQIKEVLPETLPDDFVEWDEASSSAQLAQSGSGEPGPSVGVTSNPATQDAEAFDRILLHPFRADGVEITWAAKKKWPIIAGASAALVVAAATIPVFNRGRAPSAESASAPAPTMSTNQQPEDAAPTRADSTRKMPAATAAATTAGKVQISSEATRRPLQKDEGPSREQAQMMVDQLRTPARLHMKATPAEQTPVPPGGFATADIDGLGNSSAIGAVFGSPQHPRVQAPPQQVISVPPSIAMSLLIRKSQPVYPVIARQAQVSGTIVLAALISKTGSVENLRVLSGPYMLRLAALNAVYTWRFKPYMLYNQPTAMETTINVHFSVK